MKFSDSQTIPSGLEKQASLTQNKRPQTEIASLSWLGFFICMLASLGQPVVAQQGPYMPPGLDTAMRNVAAGTATPREEMITFFFNAEVNLAAIRGDIAKDQYSIVQNRFHELNRQFSSQAVEQAGFRASIGERGFNPGTDTDVNVLSRPGRPIRLEDIQRIETNYQNIARNHFANQGANTPNQAFNTDTDFMPHPDHTDQFERIVQHINQRGGTAYSTQGAARAQMAIDSHDQVDLSDAIDFFQRDASIGDCITAKV